MYPYQQYEKFFKLDEYSKRWVTWFEKVPKNEKQKIILWQVIGFGLLVKFLIKFTKIQNVFQVSSRFPKLFSNRI